MRSIPSILFMGIFFFSLGCNNPKEISSKDEEKVNTNNENKITTMPDLSTVDFYALADDSSWIFTVQYGKEITFTDKKNNIKYHSNSNEKHVAGGADIVTIYSKNDDFTISINISLSDCHENGKQTTIMVERMKDNRNFNYSGCGVYHGSPRLHDIWVLESINSDTLYADQFPKELPHFEFNLETQKMSGFAGCNQVNGNIRFEYNKMIIEPILSTRIYCKETSPIEQKILEILNGKPVYGFNGLYLYIETTKGSLIFKKED